MIEQLLLNGEIVKIYSPKEWFDMFTEHCNKIYFERGSFTGEYCCGFHWCCNECENKICNCCADCAATIIAIYKSFGYQIDRSDIDFERFEKKAKKLYEQKHFQKT